MKRIGPFLQPSLYLKDTVFIIIISFFLFSGPSKAVVSHSKKSAVTITVREQQTSTPIDSVFVSLEGIGNPDIFEGYTDSSGSIAFVNIPTDVGDRTIAPPQKFFLSNPHPQPTKNQSNIDFVISDNQDVTITLYNVVGQKIISYREDLPLGNYKANLNLDNLSAGIYIVKIQAGQQIASERIIKLSPSNSAGQPRIRLSLSGKSLSFEHANKTSLKTLTNADSSTFLLTLQKVGYISQSDTVVVSSDTTFLRFLEKQIFTVGHWTGNQDFFPPPPHKYSFIKGPFYVSSTYNATKQTVQAAIDCWALFINRPTLSLHGSLNDAHWTTIWSGIPNGSNWTYNNEAYKDYILIVIGGQRDTTFDEHGRHSSKAIKRIDFHANVSFERAFHELLHIYKLEHGLGFKDVYGSTTVLCASGSNVEQDEQRGAFASEGVPGSGELNTLDKCTEVSLKALTFTAIAARIDFQNTPPTAEVTFEANLFLNSLKLPDSHAIRYKWEIRRSSTGPWFQAGQTAKALALRYPYPFQNVDDEVRVSVRYYGHNFFTVSFPTRVDGTSYQFN